MTFIRKKKVKDKVYLIEVKNVRENGKIKQKFVRYLENLFFISARPINYTKS